MVLVFKSCDQAAAINQTWDLLCKGDFEPESAHNSKNFRPKFFKGWTRFQKWSRRKGLIKHKWEGHTPWGNTSCMQPHKAKPKKMQESKQNARFHLFTRNMFLIETTSDICHTRSLTLIFPTFTAFCCLTSITDCYLFYHLFFPSFCWDWFQNWAFLTFIYYNNFIISHQIWNYQLCTYFHNSYDSLNQIHPL